MLLSPFSLAELQTLLCGTRRIWWSEADLRLALRPVAPLTRESALFSLIVAELMRMGHEQRYPPPLAAAAALSVVSQ